MIQARDDQQQGAQKMRATVVLNRPETATEKAAFDAVMTAKEGEFASVRVGGKIDGHAVVANLAEGGMGAVYRVKDASGNDLALKAPLPEGRGGTFQHRMKRFLREVRLTQRMNHPGVAKLVGVGQEDGLPYFTMELVQGMSLADRMWGGSLEIDEAAAIIEGAARAIHHVHEQGVIHRDLKPQNILVRPTGEVVIIDLGLARDAAGIDPRITQSGVWLGTPAYIAPEQAQGEASKVDARADVYSLAAVLYEAITGETPYGSGSAKNIFRRLKTTQAATVRVLRPECPEAIEAAVMKGIAKDRDQRFASGLELAEALAAARKTARLAPARSPLSDVSALESCTADLTSLFARAKGVSSSARAAATEISSIRTPKRADDKRADDKRADDRAAPEKRHEAASKLDFAADCEWHDLATSDARGRALEPRRPRGTSTEKRVRPVEARVNRSKKLEESNASARNLLVIGAPALLAICGLLLLIL